MAWLIVEADVGYLGQVIAHEVSKHIVTEVDVECFQE
jgi:hypothetical protein